MQIIFKKKNFVASDFINKFSLCNKNSGAIFSFIGKARPKNQSNNVLSIDIELYEKMALCGGQLFPAWLVGLSLLIDFLPVTVHTFSKYLYRTRTELNNS